VLFGWYGFRLEHPEDWAPVTLTGARNEGYARLASSDTISGQVRWRTVKSVGDLKAVLDSYFAKLNQDAKRQRVSLTTEYFDAEGRIDYRWSAKGQGRGSLIYSEACSRAFFIEASTTSNRSVQGAHRQLLASFVSEAASERELWAVFGLEARLPAGLQLTKQTFQSGRTRLEFRHRKGQIVAERWGFGEQILARHTFHDWATNAMAIPKPKIDEESEGLVLTGRSLTSPLYGLAQLQKDRNQIVTIRVASRAKEWRPTWDWLT